MRCVIALAVILVATVASGFDIVTSGDFRFQPVEPPAIVTWSIATADNRSVSLQVRVFGNNGGFSWWQPVADGDWSHITNAIDESLAPACNMDFAAWRGALADLDYNRSIMQFGDQVRELPLLRFGNLEGFELSRLLIFTGGYFWPNWPGGNASVSFSAHEPVKVPEPATWLLLLAVGAWLVLRR